MESIDKSDSTYQSQMLNNELLELVGGRLLGKFKEPLPSMPLFYEELMNLGDEETVLAKLIEFYVKTSELEAQVPVISQDEVSPAKRKRNPSQNSRRSKRRRRN